jgi:hypothetical protein
MDTAQAKMFVSSLNNSAAKILVAFIMARTALDVQELREWTALKRETIYGGLELLRARGMVESQTVEHGRMVWLPAGDFLPGIFQVSAKPTPELQESTKRTSASLIVVGGDSKELINLDPPPTEQMSTKRTSELPGALEILRRTDLLFDGSFVNSKDLEHCTPEEVLAWCAYAYSQFQKGQSDRPAGLVRRKLLDGEQATEKMRGCWSEILPHTFLEAVGLVTAVTEDAVSESDELQANDLEYAAAVHERVRLALQRAEAKQLAKATRTESE